MDKEKNGLLAKYIVQKVDGSPVDEGAFYFILRIDSGGEKVHVKACRKALQTYADHINPVWPEFAKDLYKQLHSYAQLDEVVEKADDLRRLTNELETNFILPREHGGIDLKNFAEIIAAAEPKLLAELRKPLVLEGDHNE